MFTILIIFKLNLFHLVADSVLTSGYQLSEFQKKILSSIVQNFISFLAELIANTYNSESKVSHKALYSLDYWKDFMTVIVSTYPIFIGFISNYQFSVSEICEQVTLPEVKQNISSVAQNKDKIDFIEMLIAFLPYAKSRSLISVLIAIFNNETRVQVQEDGNYLFERDEYVLRLFSKVKSLIYAEITDQNYLRGINSIMKIATYVPFLTRLLQICSDINHRRLSTLYEELLRLLLDILDRTNEPQMIILEMINFYDFFSEMIQNDLVNRLRNKYNLKFKLTHEILFHYANQTIDRHFYSEKSEASPPTNTPKKSPAGRPKVPKKIFSVSKKVLLEPGKNEKGVFFSL
jgi:hypothetical protein